MEWGKSREWSQVPWNRVSPGSGVKSHGVG
jgi:hypothetical protein